MTCIVGCLVPVFRPYSEWYHVHQSYLHLLFQHNTMPHTLYSYKPPSVKIFSLSSDCDWTLLSFPLCLVMVVSMSQVLVWSPWVSLLWSHWRLVWITQGVSLLHWPLSTHWPARDTRGHQHQATGTLAWPGLAWQVSLSLHWLLLTSHWPGLHWLLDPGPRNTPHTRWWGRRILQYKGNVKEIEGSGSDSGNKIWRWVTKHLQGLTN